MNELVKRFVMLGARHLLTYIGGFLVGNGIIDGTESSNMIGAVMVLIGVAWSAYEAHKTDKTIKVAKAETIAAKVETVVAENTTKDVIDIAVSQADALAARVEVTPLAPIPGAKTE